MASTQRVQLCQLSHLCLFGRATQNTVLQDRYESHMHLKRDEDGSGQDLSNGRHLMD